MTNSFSVRLQALPFSVIPGRDTLIYELIATEDKEQESCANALPFSPTAITGQNEQTTMRKRHLMFFFFQCKSIFLEVR